jgi:uncharacterized protein (UPF0332 family)
MTPDERREIIAYRLERSRKALTAARRLAADPQTANDAVNRLYYMCFYAATAVLISLGLAPTTHHGVRQLVNGRLGQSGGLPHELVAVFNNLYQARNRGDYEDRYIANPDDLPRQITDAERFVAAMEGLVVWPE